MLLKVGKSSFLASHHATLATVESSRGLGVAEQYTAPTQIVAHWVCIYTTQNKTSFLWSAVLLG